MTISQASRSIALILMTFGPTLSLACQPCPDISDEDRINAAWKESEAIFVATVVKIEKLVLRDAVVKDVFGKPFETPAERVTFRVERVFKGNIKPNDRYITKTNVSNGSCGKSASPDAAWFPIGSTEEMSKQWLIYSRQEKTHGLYDCSSLPLNLGGDYDIKILEALKSAKSTAQ